MNIQKLNKATKILEQLKQLDAEILSLDRFAIKVANRDTSCSIAISLEDHTKQSEKKENAFDEHGFIKKQYLEEEKKSNPQNFYDAISSLRSRMGLPIYDIGVCQFPIIPKETEKLEHKLSDKETLEVLGILLASKQQARQLLLKALEQLGVSL